MTGKAVSQGLSPDVAIPGCVRRLPWLSLFLVMACGESESARVSLRGETPNPGVPRLTTFIRGAAGSGGIAPISGGEAYRLTVPFCEPGPPRVFTVDPSAPPDGDGVERPWNSTAQVTAGPVLRCPSKFEPGDTIQFLGGATFPNSACLRFDYNNVDVDAVGWDDADRLTLTTAGNGNAIIETGALNGIVVYDLGYITIQNLTLRGNFDPGSGANICHGYGEIDGDAYTNTPYGKGVYLLNDLDTTLRSITLSNDDIGYYCIGLFAQRDYNSVRPYDHIQLSYLRVHDNNSGGVTWRGWDTTDLYAGYNQIYRNHGTGQFSPGPSDSSLGSGGEGLLLTRLDGDAQTLSLIEYNSIWDNGGNNPCAPNGGQWGGLGVYGQYFRVRDNEVWGQRAHPTCLTDNMGFNINGRHWIAERNYSHDNDGFGVLLDGGGWQADRSPDGDGIFRYNILEHNGAFQLLASANHPAPADLMVLGSINGYEIYNNTLNGSANQNLTGSVFFLGAAVYLNPVDGHLGDNTLQNVTFRNNILLVNRRTDCQDAGRWVYAELDPSTSAMRNVRFIDNDYYAVDSAGCGPDPYPPVVWRGTRYSLASWAALDEIGEVSPVKNEDPRICTLAGASADAYGLQTGSPMIDAGVDNGVSGLIDYFLNPAPYGPAYDIGAREWQGVDDCPQQPG